MKFYIYCNYDPETEAFDNGLNLTPLPMKEMREQYRRAFIKASKENKAFMEGKKALLIGEFDDVTGKIKQDKIIEVFLFHEEKEEKLEDKSSNESQVENA